MVPAEGATSPAARSGASGRFREDSVRGANSSFHRVEGVAFPSARGRTVAVVPNPIQPLIENLSAYPGWLVSACLLIVLTGFMAFFFRVFRFVIVTALVMAGLILTAYAAMRLTD